MKPLILFATDREAAESLKRYNAVEGDLSGYFHSDIASFLITGMGPIAAASKLSKVIDSHSEVINIGIAGTLREELEGFHQVALVGKQTFYPKSYSLAKQTRFQEIFLPQILLEKEGKRLMTMDYPLHCASLRKELAKEWELVDMEGWAIATCSKLHHKPCRLFKLISDVPGENSSKEIRLVIDELSAKAADNLNNLI